MNRPTESTIFAGPKKSAVVINFDSNTFTTICDFKNRIN